MTSTATKKRLRATKNSMKNTKLDELIEFRYAETTGAALVLLSSFIIVEHHVISNMFMLVSLILLGRVFLVVAHCMYVAEGKRHAPVETVVDLIASLARPVSPPCAPFLRLPKAAPASALMFCKHCQNAGHTYHTCPALMSDDDENDGHHDMSECAGLNLSRDDADADEESGTLV
jgi:hypothetical protein